MTDVHSSQMQEAEPQPAEPQEEFFDELDDAKQSAGRSCCTVWTLGLLLLVLLGIGLWLIFTL